MASPAPPPLSSSSSSLAGCLELLHGKSDESKFAGLAIAAALLKTSKENVSSFCNQRYVLQVLAEDIPLRRFIVRLMQSALRWATFATEGSSDTTRMAYAELAVSVIAVLCSQKSDYLTTMVDDTGAQNAFGIANLITEIVSTPILIASSSRFPSIYMDACVVVSTVLQINSDQERTRVMLGPEGRVPRVGLMTDAVTFLLTSAAEASFNVSSRPSSENDDSREDWVEVCLRLSLLLVQSGLYFPLASDIPPPRHLRLLAAVADIFLSSVDVHKFLSAQALPALIASSGDINDIHVVKSLPNILKSCRKGVIESFSGLPAASLRLTSFQISEELFRMFGVAWCCDDTASAEMDQWKALSLVPRLAAVELSMRLVPSDTTSRSTVKTGSLMSDKVYDDDDEDEEEDGEHSPCVDSVKPVSWGSVGGETDLDQEMCLVCFRIIGILVDGMNFALDFLEGSSTCDDSMRLGAWHTVPLLVWLGLRDYLVGAMDCLTGFLEDSKASRVPVPQWLVTSAVPLLGRWLADSDDVNFANRVLSLLPYILSDILSDIAPSAAMVGDWSLRVDHRCYMFPFLENVDSEMRLKHSVLESIVVCLDSAFEMKSVTLCLMCIKWLRREFESPTVVMTRQSALLYVASVTASVARAISARCGSTINTTECRQVLYEGVSLLFQAFVLQFNRNASEEWISIFKDLLMTLKHYCEHMSSDAEDCPVLRLDGHQCLCMFSALGLLGRSRIGLDECVLVAIVTLCVRSVVVDGSLPLSTLLTALSHADSHLAKAVESKISADPDINDSEISDSDG